jgi:anti-sigma factor RsiW
VSNPAPFDPVRDAPLLSAYVDGELEPADVARVEAHLKQSAEARAEVERLRAFNRLTAGLQLREAPPEDWEVFWKSAYNRAERSVGWILFSAGVLVVGAYGLWLVAVAVFGSTLPVVVKAAIMAGATGLLVLLLSVLRERVFTRRRTRYDDIVR